MSQENIDVVKRFETLMVPSLEETDDEAAHRQHEEILSILDPEVVFFATPSLPHGGTYVGHDAFFKMGEQFRATSGTSPTASRWSTSTVVVTS